MIKYTLIFLGTFFLDVQAYDTHYGRSAPAPMHQEKNKEELYEQRRQEIENKIKEKLLTPEAFTLSLFTKNLDVVLDHDIFISPEEKTFSIMSTDTRGRRHKITGRIDWMIDVPTLKYDLKHEEVIQADHITWKRVMKDRLPKNAILTQEELVGQTPRTHLLRAGYPIVKKDVQKPVLIRKGDYVKVSHNVSYFSLSTHAIARGSGGLGETIFLETVPTTARGKGKVIQAFVSGPQTAQARGGA